MLTYIGFDGISTLSEEAKNPRRNILLATVLVCLFTGIVGSLQVYLAQLIWPDWSSYPDVDTAFVHVAGRAGRADPVRDPQPGAPRRQLRLRHRARTSARAGCSTAWAGTTPSRARFFGVVNPKTHVPSNNVILVGAIALAGAFP